MITGRAARTAIACVSRLAEVYDGGTTLLKAETIAQDRRQRAPFLRKILSDLARAGLVTSSPGPGGGFTLAMPPDRITVLQVMSIFERPEEFPDCPFGGGICGEGGFCPLHERLAEARAVAKRFLAETTFGIFRPGQGGAA
ncbi:Rrf2 family transcriptional regulator [bacterium]|nr:Rrf2 family transcriptional regulator [bacterium]